MQKVTNIQLWNFAKTDFCVKPSLSKLIYKFIERKAIYECHRSFTYKTNSIQNFIAKFWSVIEFKLRKNIGKTTK